jgi:hypothetical protein
MVCVFGETCRALCQYPRLPSETAYSVKSAKDHETIETNLAEP